MPPESEKAAPCTKCSFSKKKSCVFYRFFLLKGIKLWNACVSLPRALLQPDWLGAIFFNLELKITFNPLSPVEKVSSKIQVNMLLIFGNVEFQFQMASFTLLSLIVELKPNRHPTVKWLYLQRFMWNSLSMQAAKSPEVWVIDETSQQSFQKIFEKVLMYLSTTY